MPITRSFQNMLFISPEQVSWISIDWLTNLLIGYPFHNKLLFIFTSWISFDRLENLLFNGIPSITSRCRQAVREIPKREQFVPSLEHPSRKLSCKVGLIRRASAYPSQTSKPLAIKITWSVHLPSTLPANGNIQLVSFLESGDPQMMS